MFYNVHIENNIAKNTTASGAERMLKEFGLTSQQIERALQVGVVPRSFCNSKIKLVWIKKVGE
jgi:hypothetical protein